MADYPNIPKKTLAWFSMLLETARFEDKHLAFTALDEAMRNVKIEATAAIKAENERLREVLKQFVDVGNAHLQSYQQNPQQHSTGVTAGRLTQVIWNAEQALAADTKAGDAE